MITNHLKPILPIIGAIALVIGTSSCELEQDEENLEIEQIQPEPDDDGGGEDPECPSC